MNALSISSPSTYGVARRFRVILAVALLLGFALALPSATGARSAELPSRNTPPAATAKTCSIDGVPGVVLPGSDTCLRINGSVSAGVIAGSQPNRRWNDNQ